jgi:NADPH-dependent F420 reductase
MGSALACALAKAGVPLVVGSRDPGRAEAQAAQLRTRTPHASVAADDYRGAAARADVVLLAIDFADARTLLPALGDVLAGKIVVDPTTPWGEHVPATSGSAELAALLPEGTALVAAWKTTFSDELSSGTSGEPPDVLVCGDDAGARVRIGELVRATGCRPLDCGGLEHAGTLEGMTRMMGAVVRNLGLPKGTVPAFHLATAPPRR